MEALQGYALSSLPMDGLYKVADLLEYDGPILSHFKDSSGINYLFYWVDYDAHVNRWLVWKITEEQLVRYLKGQDSLRDLQFEKNKDYHFSVEIDRMLEYRSITMLPFERIPGTYLVEEDSFFSMSIPEANRSISEKERKNDFLGELVQKLDDVEIRFPMPIPKEYRPTSSRERENDFLHELVQKLDENELRFCIDLAEKSSRKRPEKVLELLQDLRKAPEYAPQRLRSKYGKSLEVIRFKLKQHILRALRLLDTQQTVDQEISVHLANEGILHRKGIYDQARHELDQARKLAENHQRMGSLLEVLKLEQLRCLETETRSMVEEIERNRHYILEVMHRYEEEIVAITHYQQVFSSYRTENRPLYPEPPNAHASVFPTFNTLLYNTLTASLLARKRGDYKAASLEVKKAIDLYNAHPHIKESQIAKFKILLSNYAVSLIPERAFDEIKAIIAELQQIEDRSYNEQAESFQNIVRIRLLLMLNTLDFTDLEETAQEVETGMALHGDRVNAARKLAIWHNLFILYFIQEDYVAALKYSSRIIEAKRAQVRKEIQSTTRMMEQIVLIELDRWKGSMVKAFDLYLRRNDQVTPLRENMVRFLRQLDRTPLLERKDLFRNLAKTLQSLADSPDNPDTFELKVLSAWTCAKLEEKPLKDCLASLLG